MEKMGSCPCSPKLTQLNLGPRSLAGLIIPFQFLLVWFGMSGMPIVKSVGLVCPHAGHKIGMPSETDFDVRFSIIS